MKDVFYRWEVDYIGENDVVFYIKKTGVELVKKFNSPYLAGKFVNKIKRSKKCGLIIYPHTDRV